MPRYTASILKDTGAEGPNGERFCAFMRDEPDPLNSFWKWCQTEEEAERVLALWESSINDPTNPYSPKVHQVRET